MAVQHWDDLIMDDWVDDESQNILHRFPVTIFSQDQIALMAESPRAILHRVDEAIDRASWQVQWDRLETLFFSKLAEMRSCDVRLAEKDRLIAEKTDLEAKLKVFEASEDAGVLKAFRKRRRQRDEMEHLLSSFEELGQRLEEMGEEFQLSDLSPGLVGPADDADAELTAIHEALNAKVLETRAALRKQAQEFQTIFVDQTMALHGGEWKKALDAAVSNHEKLMQTFKDNGVVDDPEAFAKIGQRKQVVEKSLSDLKVVEITRKRALEAAKEAQADLLEHREALQALRKDFLTNKIGTNQYVRIELVEYGSKADADDVEADLRSLLGCEDTRFASAIRDPENDRGIVETLYRDLERNDVDEQKRRDLIKSRLKEFRISCNSACRGTDSDLPSAFASYLKNAFERRPEMLDRLRIWLPEDSLKVKYSKGGTGRNFTNLQKGSPGEKAAALLAFFLAYGKDPLIIDQPENDLDNHLVTDLVVKQLMDNKNRRQIIVVTHNPNIVVNGDAEMVHAMEYVEGQCQPKVQGSLQKQDVRDEVCAVMEGGTDALKKRYQRLI